MSTSYFEMDDYESGSEAWGCSSASIRLAAEEIADEVKILAGGRYKLTLERLPAPDTEGEER